MRPAPAPIPPLRLPQPDERLRDNYAWRYYYIYGGEFAFARRAVHHLRRRRVEWALHLLAPWRDALPRRCLLDVGCGPGESTLLLARELGGFERVLGLELTPELMEMGRAFSEANGIPARFLRGGCEHIPLGARSVSLLCSFEMIEHVPGWPGFFREVRRVLEPGGWRW